MRTFEYRDDSSNKFWNIELKGDSFTVTFGRIGSKGQTQEKRFPNESKAQQEHDKLVREKQNKGYVETTPATPPAASNPMQRALEEALSENPDDLATHAAYADFLTEQGDPRGELIQVQLALEDEAHPADQRQALREREKALLEKHGREWLGELAPYLLDQKDVSEYQLTHGEGYDFRFARGWIDTIRFYELSLERAAAFRTNPLLRLLRHLVIPKQDYDAPGLSDLARSPYLGNLRALQLGPDIDSCHMNGEEAVPLIQMMPRIEDLRLYAHQVDVDQLFAMSLPHLRILHVYHLHEYPLALLASNASLGRLTELKCWPHALEPDDESAYITPEGARAIFHSRHLKNLKHLELRLTDFGDEGCVEIVKSGILKRLETLDLTGGRVTDAGARTLAGCPDLKRLKSLTLVNNYLSPAGVQQLQAVGVSVEAGEQFTEFHPNEPEHLWYGDCE